MIKPNCNPIEGCGQPNLAFRPFMNVETEVEPVNTVAPVASGAPAVGSNLNVTNGTWLNAPTSYSYQWTRNTAPIFGANANSYLVTVADVGLMIACIVTATNAQGSASAVSNSIGPIV